MSSGVYGTVRGADFNISDAEIWLSYRSNRTVQGDGFTKVDTSKYLSIETDGSNQISGLYQLKLPLDTFNKVGIYNIYIRPKQVEATIKDVGVLSSYPEIRGIILDTSVISGITSGDNDSLVGYRIEYFDSEGNKKPNMFRIVTSNNKCEPTNQTINGTISYRFNDNSNLSFLTLTPSSSSSARPTVLPFIGNIQDKILITNTFFNPEMIEIEMTSNDIQSLYESINGDQIIDMEHGIATIYDSSNNIINQKEQYYIKTDLGDKEYRITKNKTDIDFSQDYNDIMSKK